MKMCKVQNAAICHQSSRMRGWGCLFAALLLLCVVPFASARTVTTILQNGVELYQGCEDAEAYDDPDYLAPPDLLGIGERTEQIHRHYALIRFRDIASTLNVTNIVKAELQLYLVSEESRVPAFVSTFRVLQNWDAAYLEQSLDGWYTYQAQHPWNGPGLTVANNIASEDSFADRAYIPMPQTVVADGIGQWYSWDITDAVRHWYDGSWKEYGIVLTGADIPNSFKQFASSDHSDTQLRPRLVVTHNPEELIGDISAHEEDRTLSQTTFRPGVRVVVTVHSSNGLSDLAATVRVTGPDYDTGLAVMHAGVEPGAYEYTWNTSGLVTGDYAFTVTFTNPTTQQKDTLGDFVLRIDADPPVVPTLQINQGATTTSSRDVVLTMSVSDATEMLVSGDIVQPVQAWAPVVQTTSAQLSEGDGLKRIQVEFRDAAGNVSEPVEAFITLDATPIDIVGLTTWNADDRSDADGIYKSGQHILIQILVDEAFDLAEASIQVTGTNLDTGSLPVLPDANGELLYEWDTTLLSDGVYQIQASLSDTFDRLTQYPPVNGIPFEVAIDSFPPANPKIIVLNAGVQTQVRSLDIGLEAQGATAMFLSGDVLDDANTFQWIPYLSQARVHLVGDDGVKRIAASFRDAAGNETASVETSIRLEVQPPTPLEYGTLMLNADQSGVLTLFFDEPVNQIQPDSFQVTLHNLSNDQETLLFTADNTHTGVDGERLWLQIPPTNPLQTWTLSTGGNLLLSAEIAANSVLDASGNGNEEQDPSLRIQVQIINPGQLGSVTAAPSTISPNADGVQDSVFLQYTPLQSGTIRFTAKEANGTSVYEELIPNQRQGIAYQLEWHGTGQDGATLPDGSYSLSVVLLDTITSLEMPLMEAFAVALDTQGPVIQDVVPVAGTDIPARATFSASIFDTGTGLKEAYLIVDQSAEHWALEAVGERMEISGDSGPTLATGSHTITFHAEDFAGNQTEQSRPYNVVVSDVPILQFFNFPNPFAAGTSTQLLVSLSQPIAGGSIRIYDGAGDLVYHIDMKDVGLIPNEYRIPWDGRSLYGDLLARGVYFAELRIEPDNADVKRRDRVRRHKVALW